MMTPVARAKSLLFVPASRPERFVKAYVAGADCVIVDLEDAVAPDQKDYARDHLPHSLAGLSRSELARTLVRINAAGTVWHEADLAMVRDLIGRGLAGVMVPKSETPADLDAAVHALGQMAQVVPLIESLAGFDALDLLVRTSQVTRIAFGHLDFQLDLGIRCSPEELELGAVRFALVAASRRANLPAPIDGVSVDTSDPERLLQDARRARALGFGGKLCIHPNQVKPVDSVFLPTAAEVEWATRVLTLAKENCGAAFSLDGRMVDFPVIALAQRTLLQVQPTNMDSKTEGASQ